MAEFLAFFVRMYQKYISRFTPASCRFYPTCSQYSLEALRTHGALKGTYLTVRRLLKCHPFHPGGIDYVPEKKERSRQESEHFRRK
ncbi:membrane protein insertion efficiency factor YidD [Alkalicoccus luteus]|uniref:Putative membrane protein insertion efficiency factor n=1 Tax=Alkalicoccus luteus TaxID=1237094 RepID=A0A969PUX8_9BACI|nr:membrane protein insertion efficiency factor YidD [Alkalicoccus luteus]NJP38851.1 membrane protein insertion efficiency factor YidD [Alkalicoccus luteus]